MFAVREDLAVDPAAALVDRHVDVVDDAKRVSHDASVQASAPTTP